MAFDLSLVQKDIRKMKRFLKHAPKHATPKQVHSLRMAIRRFEAAMRALALDCNANEERLLRKLAELRKRTGKVRDLDVLTGNVANLKLSGEEQCQVELLEYLGAEHADRSQQLHSFAVKHGESLRRRFKRTATYLNTSAENITANETALGHTMMSELRLQRELTKPVRLTEDNLHPYRLQIKELRYILEMEKDPADRVLIETLGQMKDAIGEWHDWQQLAILARDHLSHGSGCKLIPLLQETAQKKLKHALTVAKAGKRQIHCTPAGSRA